MTHMNTTGMTVKEFALKHFYDLLEEYRTCDPFQDTTRFVALSVALHAAKGSVPKALWPMVNRARYAAHRNGSE